MELQPGRSNALVAAWHKDVLLDLAPYPYEAAALLRLALLQAEARTFDNFLVGTRWVVTSTSPEALTTLHTRLGGTLDPTTPHHGGH
ncbi:hypothetical protein ACFWSF_33475 [Streptomyces sp. NPDC058611]|uniref:hypothetical protein n=1 Tax=unclassified Streptomyces TaxID=2593676 RepID=UPI00365A1535